MPSRLKDSRKEERVRRFYDACNVRSPFFQNPALRLGQWYLVVAVAVTEAVAVVVAMAVAVAEAVALSVAVAVAIAVEDVVEVARKWSSVELFWGKKKW